MQFAEVTFEALSLPARNYAKDLVDPWHLRPVRWLRDRDLRLGDYRVGPTADPSRVRFFVSGRGGFDATFPDQIEIDRVLYLLITRSEQGPIPASDIEEGTAHGGLLAMRNDMEDVGEELYGVASPFRFFRPEIRETRLVRLHEMLATLREEWFVWIWRSLRDGKFKARMIDHDLPVTLDGSGDPRRLRAHNIYQNSLSLDLRDERDIETRIRIQHDYDELSGAYRSTVSVDGSTSEDYRGQTSSAQQAIAARAQALFGQSGRAKTIALEFRNLQERRLAWHVLVRRLRVKAFPRPRLTVRIGDGWASDLDEAMVFETDAGLDDIVRYPALVSPGSESLPSWEGRKWFVTGPLGLERGEPVTVGAVNIDDWTGL